MSYLNIPYDFESVTHYWKRAFSQNGRDTIQPKDASIQIKINGLSRIDKIKINKLYNCSRDHISWND